VTRKIEKAGKKKKKGVTGGRDGGREPVLRGPESNAGIELIRYVWSPQGSETSKETSGVPSTDWLTAARGHAHLAETTATHVRI